ncbi:hypothetical protein [Pontiella agarivorans]|uniref:Chromosome partition protein Smc n=1 Tax=Pontiella agarivorans TaxID=3038953 RepID=A0ABU5MXC9_9BACT|nr:hypothetical protein [Pontiella agarivorans]MDZ8118868.1 hypothetical protein [Pontiella agarivorans]
MRRSILICMLDVMVLSVLALNARHTAGGGAGNIPAPTGRAAGLIEEGLRNEAGYREEIARLEARLKESAEISRKALEQAALVEARAERQRAENLQALEKLRAAELAAMQARSQADVAAREAELVSRQAEEARARTREFEAREREAKAQAEAALARVALAEKLAEEAERRAKEIEKSADSRETEILAIKEEVARARAEKEVAEQRAKELRTALADREAALHAARAAEAEASAKAAVALTERERLAQKTEQVTEELVEARVSVATLKTEDKEKEAAIAKLEAEKKKAVEEQNASVWVRRDEAMRRVMVSYTEQNGSSGRLYRVNKQLFMPLVQVGGFTLVPAEFKALGLKKSFFGGGLSDRITDVRGVAAPMVGEAKSGSLRTLIVPVEEPQVCLAHASAAGVDALKPVTMAGIKKRRMRTAMLFSYNDVNAYGLVEIVPMLGRDYLRVRAISGSRPQVGDYLLTDRGEFIGVMVENEVCYVLPQELASEPKPVIIPLRAYGRQEGYLTEFVDRLNEVRKLVDEQSKTRGF